MSQNFNAAAVTALFQAVQSTAAGLGDFKNSLTHEPRSAPGAQLNVAFWLASIASIKASGLATTSGLVVFTGRVYRPSKGANAKELDSIDPQLLSATCDLIAAFSNGFTLGQTVREVDLLGQFGTPLSATAAYLEQDGQQFRVMEVNVPIVVDDLWSQEG